MRTGCLLYGVVFSRAEDRVAGHPPGGLPPGIDGTPVKLIDQDGLTAAVSMVSSSDLTPSIGRVLAFAKVVEALHADRTVLPMRYGCLLAGETEVLDLLHARRQEYAEILRALHGCVEMGVRILVPSTPASSGSTFDPEMPVDSGRAYLSGRAVRYARAEAAARALATITERLQQRLGGLAERIETDPAAGRDRDFSSLCFLVKRGAVEAFRDAFRQMERTESSQLLLSGPWPPYSFVAPKV